MSQTPQQLPELQQQIQQRQQTRVKAPQGPNGGEAADDILPTTNPGQLPFGAPRTPIDDLVDMGI